MAYSLPHPSQTNYLSNDSLKALLEDVKFYIERNVFEFVDKPYYESFENLSEANDIIYQFKWKIERYWAGSKDDGHSRIRIKAIV